MDQLAENGQGSEHSDIDLPDKQREAGPSSQIEVLDSMVAPPSGDPFLEENNFGVGNYSDAEYWQQIESFANYLYADSAFKNVLIERAIFETKTELAIREWQALADDGEAPTVGPGEEFASRQGWIREKRNDLWDRVGDEDLPPDTPEMDRREYKAQKRLELVKEIAGVSRGWTAPHGRMIMMRHESSRSREARLLDNFFGRKSEEEIRRIEKGGRRRSLLRRRKRSRD